VTYEPGEVCCLNTSLSFGFSIANLFLPLMSGVPLVVLSGEQIRDIHQMMSVLEREGVTRIVVVPAVLKQILDADFGAESRLSKIRSIGVAGGRLLPVHLQRLQEALPKVKLQNRYASTEIGTVAAIWDGSGEITIGRPVANTCIYILDRYMNPVPAGVAGEIYVGAAHLARGYLHRPELTAERFLTDPFHPEPGKRMYRTGDLGRFRSNGEIEFIGRTDDQVKINGFRIDLPEVERALAGHQGVSEAAAAIREIGSRHMLVAYIVTKPVGTPSASQLRAYLGARLPSYMIPSRTVFLKDLPTTASGKPDRNALPLLEPIRPNLETAYEPPGSPMEAAIAQIWSDLLGLDPIGIHDDFADLGGDSLMAAQVAVRVGERFGVEITSATLFDQPSVAKLAVCLSGPCQATQAWVG
jgi:acyl-coenzyme A synthetase/AMP-(fatty) acid ligase/acyl carrier protein